MRRPGPARLFLLAGLGWQAAVMAWWLALAVRLAIELRLEPFQLLALGAALEGSLLVAEVPTGVLADRVSRKWSVVVGFVSVGGAQVAAGLVSGFWPLILTQVVWGVGYTFRSGAEIAWVTDELGGPEAVEPLVLRQARWQLVASVAAVGASALLAHLTSLATAVVVSGLATVGVGLALAVLMTEHHHPRRSSGAGGGDIPAPVPSFRAGARATLGHRSLRVLTAVMLLAGLANETVDRLNIRRLDQIGLSAGTRDPVVVVAVVSAVEALLGAAVLWWARHRVAGDRVAVGLAAMLAASAVGIAGLGLVANLPVAVACLVGQGALRSAALPLPQTWANAHAPPHLRATVLSFVGQANAAGEIAGGLALGVVAAATSIPVALTGSALLTLAAAATCLLAPGALATRRDREAIPVGVRAGAADT
ncbi:MAG: MFS transporter [Acidimicrobiales bacterium]